MTHSNQLCQATPLNGALAQPQTRPVGSKATLLTRLFVALQRLSYHRQMRRKLPMLDDRMLDDIGLTRLQFEKAASAPFWEVLRNRY